MPYPHAIRLRGPWQFEPLARGVVRGDGQVVERFDDLPPAGRSTVPSDWGHEVGAEFRGRVRYRRSFNPPGTLEAHERLWLIVEGVDARGVVSLNGTRLGEVAGYAVSSSFDITRLVGPRNEIVLDVELPADNRALRPGREMLPGGPIGEVRLEVRSPSFIESLALWSRPEADGGGFAVSGRIEGEAVNHGFAIVIGGCDRELAYIEARVGEPFMATFRTDDFPVWTPSRTFTVPVEIKLLEGSESAWQAVRSTAFRDAVSLANALHVEQIFSETEYLSYDRQGTVVVQRMPIEWSERVCPRLAHHPCITAWSAGGDDGILRQPLFGRPWI